MAQFQRMDARLDTLIDELCQVNTHVGRIARRQARLGGVESPSPPPEVFEDNEASEDDDSDDDDDDKDGDASSSSVDEMST